MSTRTVSNKQIIQISHKAFIAAGVGFSNETVLLVENIDDAEFYNHIAEYYQTYKDTGKLQLRYHPECGGGSTTCASFKKHRNNINRFCLCFADTDKKYKRAEIGDTLKKIIAIAEEAIANNIHTCSLHDTNLRELENLIPLGLMKELVDGKEKEGCLKHLESIYRIDPEIFLHFDIKNGITEKAYKKLIDILLLPKIEDVILKLGICDKKTLEAIKAAEDPQGVIIPGMGNKVLANYNERCFSKKYEEIERALVEEQRVEWLRVGEVFNNWACGYTPIRV